MKKLKIITIGLIILSFFTISVPNGSAGYDETVYQAQKKLKNLGYNPGPIDGIFGTKTEMAVKAFQGDNGLTVNGNLDEKTKKKLVLEKELGNTTFTGIIVSFGTYFELTSSKPHCIELRLLEYKGKKFNMCSDEHSKYGFPGPFMVRQNKIALHKVTLICNEKKKNVFEITDLKWLN